MGKSTQDAVHAAQISLIFDRPTSSPSSQEVDGPLVGFHELKKQGKTIIFITYKLREVMALVTR